ncbi:MAG: ABC transporter permease [Streptomycetaceae bacterium]|nr:MAG: ABC transporter permease [Streptomycetaceae bacterium]
MKKVKLSSFLLAIAAPLAAAVVSIFISSLAVLATHKSPIDAYKTMWDFGTESGSLMQALNTATPYYIAAIAIAITFRAGLFNIGVEGQLRLGALFGAYFGAMFVLPPVMHILIIMIIAMSIGGLWAAIAGYLKVKRGVSEVISTIMLNSLAGGLSSYLLANHFVDTTTNSNNLSTKTLPASGQIPDLMPILNKIGIKDQPGGGVYGMLIFAIVLGIVFWFVISRTRFGFELRASGANPIAARVSGVNSKRMTFVALAASGAIAGLAGLPAVLGETHAFNMGFRTGIGFSAIAVALLGRNNAVGMAISALLFGFLEVSSRSLELIDIAPETYVIMQGSILLSSVIAYEVVRRYKLTLQSKELAKAVEA